MEKNHNEVNPLEAPWASLYGTGTGLGSVERTNPIFQPLLHSIEEAIVDFCDQARVTPTGGSILLVVKQLGMNHEAPTEDPLACAILDRIRLSLSVNNYSQRDVKGALRTVGKSIDRHTRDGGVRGYLDFVRPFIKPRR